MEMFISTTYPFPKTNASSLVLTVPCHLPGGQLERHLSSWLKHSFSLSLTLLSFPGTLWSPSLPLFSPPAPPRYPRAPADCRLQPTSLKLHTAPLGSNWLAGGQQEHWVTTPQKELLSLCLLILISPLLTQPGPPGPLYTHSPLQRIRAATDLQPLCLQGVNSSSSGKAQGTP